GASNVVSNSCKKAAPRDPCEIVLETKSSGSGTVATVISDSSCAYYSTTSRLCTQSGISIDSTVVHGTGSSSDPMQISTSVIVVSDGGGNSISESSNLPSSANVSTTRRLICSCAAPATTVLLIETTKSTPSTTVPSTKASVATVVSLGTTLPSPTVQPSGKYSDRIQKAIEAAEKENFQFADQIRQSRLAF
ncbi:hypothetical protein PFISCL1PPCAC_26249, partial [Pristionchus fissidentatus]